MLYEIKEQFSIEMISNEGGIHISLYQPTHRYFPENKQDTIVYRNLLKEIEHSLKQKKDVSFNDSIMEPLYQLEKDNDFWNNTLDGIAVLANQNKCMIYKLTGTIKELAIVNNRFHINPLIKAFQSVESYQLLLLSQNDFSIYQGNRYGFSEIEIGTEVPRTLEAVLGKQLTDSSVNQGSFGGVGRPGIFHGLGDNKVEDNKDTEKYFRYVDHYVYENHSKTSKLPLILVSLKEYHTQFKNLSNNSYFIDESIDGSYDLIETQQLQNKVLEVVKSLNMGKIEKLIDAYKKAEAEIKSSSDLAQVTKAALESRVETILIEENRFISGKVDHSTGNIKIGDIDNPDFGNILDDLAELILRKGGNVVILSKDKMPSLTGIAAIYRYS